MISTLKTQTKLLKVRYIKPYNLIEVNLKDPNFYHHRFSKDEYVGYGVKVEKLKRYLIIRSQFVI